MDELAEGRELTEGRELAEGAGWAVHPVATTMEHRTAANPWKQRPHDTRKPYLPHEISSSSLIARSHREIF
jgi:hypothetical protein